MRIDSSNYNPFMGWEHGAQMIAFNMQVSCNFLCVLNQYLFFSWNQTLGPICVQSNCCMSSQGTGKYLWIMQGMFRGNGGCGYVKKPDYLLNDDQYNGVPVPCKPKQVKTTLKVVKFWLSLWAFYVLFRWSIQLKIFYFTFTFSG